MNTPDNWKMKRRTQTRLKSGHKQNGKNSENEYRLRERYKFKTKQKKITKSIPNLQIYVIDFC